MTEDPNKVYTNGVDFVGNLDDIIERLLQAGNLDSTGTSDLTQCEIMEICSKSKEIFMDQPMLLQLKAPLNICGDIHGQYQDLLRFLDFGKLPPKANYLFLGDYVDRGKQSLETICLLLAFKIKYPENFFCFAAITNQLLSIASTDSMMSANGDTASNCGNNSPTASTVCLLLRSLTKEYFAAMEDYRRNFLCTP